MLPLLYWIFWVDISSSPELGKGGGASPSPSVLGVLGFDFGQNCVILVLIHPGLGQTTAHLEWDSGSHLWFQAEEKVKFIKTKEKHEDHEDKMTK